MTCEQKSEGGGRVSSDNIWGSEAVRAKTEALRWEYAGCVERTVRVPGGGGGELGAGWGSPPAGSSPDPLPPPPCPSLPQGSLSTGQDPQRVPQKQGLAVVSTGTTGSCLGGPLRSVLSFRAILPLSGQAWGRRWGPTRELSAYTVPGSFQAHPGPFVWGFLQLCKH